MKTCECIKLNLLQGHERYEPDEEECAQYGRLLQTASVKEENNAKAIVPR
jgi:hypothetical protein